MEKSPSFLENKYFNLVFCSTLDEPRTLSAVAKVWDIRSAAFFTKNNIKEIEASTKAGFLKAKTKTVKAGMKPSEVIEYQAQLGNFYSMDPSIELTDKEKLKLINLLNQEGVRKLLFNVPSIKAGLYNNIDNAYNFGRLTPLYVIRAIMGVEIALENQDNELFKQVFDINPALLSELYSSLYSIATGIPKPPFNDLAYLIENKKNIALIKDRVYEELKDISYFKQGKELIDNSLNQSIKL